MKERPLPVPVPKKESSSQALLSHWGSWGLLLCTCFPKPHKKGTCNLNKATFNLEKGRAQSWEEGLGSQQLLHKEAGQACLVSSGKKKMVKDSWEQQGLQGPQSP